MTVQREVWFHKVAWSYIPCHWKGFAMMAAIIFPTVVAIIVGQMVLGSLGYGDVDWLPLAIFIPALLILLRIAKRHS
ncbi:hypothetical protein ABC347_01615 [Sphingomonas sp. 1P06PA]|uniref:hypothetical protein n=1 Tax=Sphingomonas sp. 1P06PA TaxID=554121 RepID=UPI0039A67F22